MQNITKFYKNIQKSTVITSYHINVRECLAEPKKSKAFKTFQNPTHSKHFKTQQDSKICTLPQYTTTVHYLQIPTASYSNHWVHNFSIPFFRDTPLMPSHEIFPQQVRQSDLLIGKISEEIVIGPFMDGA